MQGDVSVQARLSALLLRLGYQCLAKALTGVVLHGEGTIKHCRGWWSAVFRVRVSLISPSLFETENICKAEFSWCCDTAAPDQSYNTVPRPGCRQQRLRRPRGAGRMCRTLLRSGVCRLQERDVRLLGQCGSAGCQPSRG